MIAFWTLVRGELDEGRSNVTLWVLLVTTVLTTVVAVIVGGQDLRRRQDQFTTRGQLLQKALAEGLPLNVWGGDPGLQGLRAPEPASLWVRGFDAELPPWWAFTGAGPVEGPPDPSSTVDPEVGAVLDVGAVVRLFLSVFALSWGLEAVSGSRTRGTLQATLNQPVHCTPVVAAKLVAGGIALIVVLAIVGVAAWVTGALLAPDATRGLGSEVLLALTVPAWCYLMTMMLGAMLTGSLVRSRGRATVIVAGVWLYVAFLGPQLVAFGSRALVPTDPRPLVEVNRQRAFDAQFAAVEASVGRAYRQKLGTATLTSHPVLAEGGRLELDVLWRAEAQVTRQIVEAFDRRWQENEIAQARVRFWLMWANPGFLFLDSSTATGGTGEATETRWREAVSAHQTYLNRVLFDDPSHLSMTVPADGGGEAQDSVSIHAPVRARNLKRFQPITALMSTRLRDGLPATIGLFGYVVVLAILTFVTFPRTGD